MDAEPHEEAAAGVSNDATPHASSETDTTGELPTVAPANVSEKPLLDVSQDHTVEGSTLDVKDETHKEEEVKRDSEATIVATSHHVGEGGEKKESYHQLNPLSTKSPSTAEASGADIGENVLPGDDMEGGDGEDDSIVGSLDVCLPEDTVSYDFLVDTYRLIQTRRTPHWET